MAQRYTFRWKHNGQMMKADVWMAKADEWAALPKSQDKSWSVIKASRGRIAAIRLELADSVRLTPVTPKKLTQDSKSKLTRDEQAVISAMRALSINSSDAITWIVDGFKAHKRRQTDWLNNQPDWLKRRMKGLPGHTA